MIRYPDQILNTQCLNILESESVDDLIDEMMFELVKHNAVGIAAPQVGKCKNLAIVDFNDDTIVMLNPVITWCSESMSMHQEGCLSIPNIFVNVMRHDSIRVSYVDQKRNHKSSEFTDMHSRIVQHEVDHLNGVTMLQRVGNLERTMAVKNIRKQSKGINQ